ncbi:uncharacterized protein LOC143072863 [Mytilus galloprovincialis]|uniref:uncharacterized protein LOC143072863 n=1 Tax=Mytilus galloprovincialis TaxID=29158 RepID=UPI003F7C49B9
MASATKFKLHGPLDVWSTREKLALACSVLRSGDQNWVSVSRAIKPFGENSRSPEWFSQRNCALQYTDLLEKIETPKRKRGDKGEAENPQSQIIRQLAVDRAEELKKHVVEYQQRYKKLKRDLESIKTGQWDDTLPEIWEQIQKEKIAKEEALMEKKPETTEDEDKPKSEEIEVNSEESNQEPVIEPIDIPPPIKVEVEETSVPINKPLTLDIKRLSADDKPKPTPPTSPLLSTLLQSSKSSFGDLQQLKQEVESKDQQQTPKTSVGSTKQTESSTAAAAETTDKTSTTAPVKRPQRPSTEKAEIDPEIVVKIEPIEQIQDVQVNVEVVTEEVKQEVDKEVVVESQKEAPEVEKSDVKEEDDDSQVSVDAGNATFVSVDEEISIREEPMSPASSESSKISEADVRFLNKRGARKSSSRRSSARNKKSIDISEEDKKEDLSSQLTDGETSDDDGNESDDTAIGSASIANTSVTATFSESIPNSPLSHCSDTEDDKAHKNWKKSIMLVWRMAANHKYANVFLHPVTNEIAPGYQGIVLRPLDLTTIKKNVEAGITRTTPEFQRDMMLMFTNAIMYNSCNHNVHKMAVEMYDDVMTHIEQYVSAQLMLQSSESKSLRPSRRTESSDKSDKEDDSKRRRTFSESHQEGGKSKKRKTRGDDT